MARLPENGVICAEKQLLICCARTRMRPEIAERIREIAAGRPDWDYVLRDAADNSIGPLLEKNLRAVAAEAIPAAELERMKSASRANTVRCLFLTAELHKILGLFRERGILTLPYKGPVLAEQAYGDITLRDFDDLDIVLPQRDMGKAHEVMLSLGYAARFPWILSAGAAKSLVPGEYNYRHEERRAMVELHTEVTLRHFPLAPNLDELAERGTTIRVGGQDVRTFAPEDLLTLLCVHGSKDFWERISWIADISELVQQHSDFDWDRALKTANALRSERMLHLGLALALNLLGAPLPDAILKRVRTDLEANSVARQIEFRLLSRDAEGYGAGSRFRLRRRMVPGGIAGWKYSIRLAVVPAEEDWEMVKLPGALAPLYVALRPLRLLYKYAGMGRGRKGASP